MNKQITHKLLLKRSLPLAQAGIFIASILLCTDASAQGGNNEIRQLNQQAMAEFAEGQLESAIKLLKRAEARCTQMNVRGTPLARTYMNMALVSIRGNRDSAMGINFLTKAICQDSSAQLDPLYITGETAELFKLSQEIARTPSGCGGKPTTGQAYGNTMPPAGYPGMGQSAPVCQKGDPACDTTCIREGGFCEVHTDCCFGNVCDTFKCVPGDDPRTSGSGSGTDGPVFSITINGGTGLGIASGGSMRPENQISDGDVKYPSGLFWNKLHFRINPMFQLTKIPKLRIGATFRGDMTLDPDERSPKFGPAFLANATYLIKGNNPNGFQMHVLFGVGGGLFYHRGSYQDCKGDLADSDHPQVQDGSKDEGDAVCLEESLEQNDNGDWIWNRENPIEKPMFRKSGYVIAEFGLDNYYWFNDHFGLNFGLIADIMFPYFAVNFDLQAGAAVRF